MARKTLNEYFLVRYFLDDHLIFFFPGCNLTWKPAWFANRKVLIFHSSPALPPVMPNPLKNLGTIFPISTMEIFIPIHVLVPAPN
jgi:hypothetical protein